MRDAISILERLIVTCLNEKITLAKTEKILDVTPLTQMKTFLNHILEKDYISLVKILDDYWNSSVEIETFFKDFAKYCKNLMTKNELDIKIGLDIIELIFTSLNKFKYEEDKRLVGYVIVDSIIKNQNQNTVKIIEKTVISNENKNKNTDNKVVKDLKGITIELISQNWQRILKDATDEKIALKAFLINAVPYKIDGNTLFIGFPPEDSFSLSQMREKEYHDAFLNSIHKIIDPNIKIDFLIFGNKNKTDEKTSNLTEKIVNYFGGEII